MFQQRRNKDSESLKELYADLKRLAKDCNFGATFDASLGDQLFMAVDRLPYFKFLVAEDLRLNTLTSMRVLERIQTLENAHIWEYEPNTPKNSDSTVSKVGQTKDGPMCKQCGFKHHSSACRFKHLECRNCGKPGHLERVCKAPKNQSESKNGDKKKKWKS